MILTVRETGDRVEFPVGEFEIEQTSYDTPTFDPEVKFAAATMEMTARAEVDLANINRLLDGRPPSLGTVDCVPTGGIIRVHIGGAEISDLVEEVVQYTNPDGSHDVSFKLKPGVAVRLDGEVVGDYVEPDHSLRRPRSSPLLEIDSTEKAKAVPVGPGSVTRMIKKRLKDLV